ncbi:MAG: glycoside hydrolase family 10 protein, partial [Actinomadura sp.]
AQAAEGDAPVECPAVKAPADSQARQLRGMWIATVANVDWPSRKGLPAAEQKAEYRRLLDTARALHLNAVFVQVRPTGDALYPSRYEPWSQWLSGTQGKDPGYDVLEFLLDEAHARNLEFHAWFNPYRASWRANPDRLAPGHPARRHPDWVVRSGKGLWYDPGLPQVRDLTTDVVLDVVERYDIDGVHFDDYFYPYPGEGAFADGDTYARYGGGQGKAAWRRRNVDTLVETVSTRIRQAKPWVQFGISPFGVWRNKSTDPDGSATRALQSYDAIYADTRAWIRNGWVDYLTPQLYWPIGDARADYRVLVDWWSRQVAGTPVRLTIGQAAYRVGQAGRWRRPAELSRHLTLNARYPAVRGDVFFSAKSLAADTAGFATRLRADHYSRPAIVPAVPGHGGGAPAPVTGLRASQDGASVRLRWRGSNATSYAVYRGSGERRSCAPVDPGALLVTVRGTEAVDPGVRPGETYTYYVTALDRLHHESAPGRASRITVERG